MSAKRIETPAVLALVVLAPGTYARAQTVGHWKCEYTRSGSSAAWVNGVGGSQQWPASGLLNPPAAAFQAADTVTVSMSGTITATLRWVDENEIPITDPPPPADVFLMQQASAVWTATVAGIGEEGEGSITLGDHGASDGLGDPEVSVSGPPMWSGESRGRRLLKVDGSSGTITLPVTLDAHVTLTCTSGMGNATAQVNYNVVKIAPADCYDFSGYPSPPPAGSTPCAQDAATKLKGPLLDGSGYYTEGRAYTNQTAHHALEQLKKTAIFYVFGHGGDQYHSCQTFWAPGKQPDASSGWGAIVQTTGARDYLVGQGMPYANVVVLDERDGSGQLIIPSDAFRKVVLAVYQGCYTAELAGRGSPVQGTHNHGAKCVLGFRNVIFEASARSWAGKFWDALRDGETVSTAANSACQGLPLSDTMRQRTLLGNLQTRVHPARYGQ